jgi:hypothetical protein
MLVVSVQVIDDLYESIQSKLCHVPPSKLLHATATAAGFKMFLNP